MTELVFILDRSGSMYGLTNDTIGGFNSMIEKQRKAEGEKAFVSTVLFNDKTKVVHDRVPIDKVKEMTDSDYFTGGATALLDAVGEAIRHIGNIHKYARKEDVPKKTVFVIITDGMENASKDYTYKKVNHMIKRQKKKYGWEFIFLGANIDSANEAGRLGIDRNRAVNYNCDGIGTALNYSVLSEAIMNVRQGEDLSDDWKKDIEEDYNRRK